MSDFPLDFVTIELAAELAQLADLAVCATWTSGGAPQSDRFVLGTGARTQTLALLQDWSDGALALELREKGGAGRSITLPTRTLAPLRLDLSMLPQYGLQTVTLRCAFEPGAQVYGIDLAGEADADRPAQIGVAFFTLQATQRTWSYFAGSPFACGFVFRPHAAAGENASPWSERQLPGEVLELRAPSPVGAPA